MNDQPMTEEEYMTLLGLGTDQASGADVVARQQAMAEQLRAQAPEMRGNSRIQTAPHWLEAVGGLARNVAAQKQMEKAGEAQKAMRDAQLKQNQMIARALLARRMQQPQVQAGQPLQANPQGLQPPSGPPKTPYSLY